MVYAVRPTTSVSMVGQATNVPMVGQTKAALDEAVVSMLHQIFD